MKTTNVNSSRKSLKTKVAYFIGVKMFLVAVTGGIASGKSTVTRMFADLHCPVIDADLIAREGACVLPLLILRSPVTNYFLCILSIYI